MNKLIIALLKGKIEDKISLLQCDFSKDKLLEVCNSAELKKSYNLEIGYGFNRHKEIFGIIQRGNIKCVTISDSEYPMALKEIYDPPFMLYVRGDLTALNTNLVSVVGTRKPSLRGYHEAFRLGLDLGRENVGVVSGLALGIDGAAHSGNVVSGGQTVAVLGSGVDSIYPAANKKLAGDILQKGGAIVSEFIPGESPKSYNFPKRNRIIAGLSRNLVIIQAPKKSGALITGEFALQRGGDIFVHSVGVDDRRFLGSDRYHKDGAKKISSAYPLLQKFNKGEAFRTFDEESYSGENLLKMELNGDIVKYKGCYFTL